MLITADTMFKLRKVYRLSQADLGALCGVSDAFINQIERGKRNVTDRVKRGLVRELELTPDKLTWLLDTYEHTELDPHKFCG